MTRDKVSGDALFILKNLKDNARQGRSNRLADVKAALENSVSLDFDSYFFFLRKFHYIAMDREAQLKLTDAGDRVVDGEALEKFTTEVAEFFADQITEADGEEEDEGGEEPTNRPPPPPAQPAAKRQLPPTDLILEAPPVQPPSRGRRPTQPVSDEQPSQSSGSGTFPAPPGGGFAPLPLTAVAQQAPSSSAKGQDLDLRYVKYDQLGSGPLGTVFKGKHNALGLDISVKELKDIFGYFSFLQRGEVIKRLKKELCAQAQVRHPNIVQILDQNTDVARPYFVMELMKGSLREKLDAGQGKGVDVKAAIRWFLQLGYALKAAHHSGLTHHNIKPENVLFDHYGNAKLGDFGLSRVIEVDQSKGMPQVFVGTGGMGYMSPELMARAKDSGPSSDVYGLGILLYEMMTGQIPGRRSALPSEINKDCPAKLDGIFDKMTQDRKEQRYPDFDAVFDDFYKAFGDKEYLVRGDLILSSDLVS